MAGERPTIRLLCPTFWQPLARPLKVFLLTVFTSASHPSHFVGGVWFVPLWRGTAMVSFLRHYSRQHLPGCADLRCLGLPITPNIWWLLSLATWMMTPTASATSLLLDELASEGMSQIPSLHQRHLDTIPCLNRGTSHWCSFAGQCLWSYSYGTTNRTKLCFTRCRLFVLQPQCLFGEWRELYDNAKPQNRCQYSSNCCAGPGCKEREQQD